MIGRIILGINSVASKHTLAIIGHDINIKLHHETFSTSTIMIEA